MIKINGNYIKKEYDEIGNVEITFSFQHFYDKKKADELKEGIYCLEIKKPKSKRSLNQNAYMWAIIHEIAQELQQDDMEIYISALEQANAKYEYVMGLETIENELKKSFRAVKVIRPEIYKGKKMIVYKCFEGSSKFNTQECNKLIDVLLSWCSELDIKMETDIYET